MTDEPLAPDRPIQSPTAEAGAVEKTSARYVGRWNRLVSTTNWEKGRIIAGWRTSLIEAGAPPQAYSDEAWSRRIGHVSPQHVGRLRRVHERFGEVHKQYRGLFWSHFQAALDWNDAEMWLEGAVQSRWSVARMRAQRWEALGAPPDKKPRPEDVIAAELDEDVDAALDALEGEALAPSFGEVQPLHLDDAPPDQPGRSGRKPSLAAHPFENLPPMPPDVAEAFEAFKRAIENHKRAGWRGISRRQVFAILYALRQFALLPEEG
jgi:hypothetical protein